MRVLGIETSCDETGIAIYDAKLGLLAHSIYSQVIHADFGGVVPELASRDHIQKIIPLIDSTLKQSSLTVKEIEGIAYTKGPGLTGALLVGAMVARSLGFALDIPAIGIHHLEGHILAAYLEKERPCFPFLVLLVSGGHTELVWAENLGNYQIIGDSVDDAAGEAFDKIGKLLGLAYPAGKAVSMLAEKGSAHRFKFTRPMIDRPGLDFSFSGLKTQVAETIARLSPLNEKDKRDIAASFQETIVETLAIKCQRALKQTKARQLVVAGGVSANVFLRSTLQQLADKNQIKLFVSQPIFCTDNGAMIAYAGCQRLMAGQQEGLDVTVLPRWPLDQCLAVPI